MKFSVLLLLVLPVSLFAQAPLKNIPEQAPVVMTVGNTVRDSAFVCSQPDRLPQFPGGESGLHAYLADSLVYPAMEKETGVEGDVYIGFIVEKTGMVSNVHEVHGVMGASEFTAEAMRVIAAMPQWEPGTIEGKPVRVLMIIPVKFVLHQSE